MATSPTRRTLLFLRGAGMLCEVVEKWNPHARVRQDLFGIIDVVALDVDRPGLLGVQATAASGHAARRKKILASENATAWLAAGNRLWVVSWGKKQHGKRQRWEPRIEEITRGMVDEFQHGDTLRASDTRPGETAGG